MDVVGRIHLRDGTELHAITGIDDNSRFCVCARLVHSATARPVCDAFLHAMSIHGVPDQVLTDNGKVFTARFGKGPGPVLFDRICAQNGIRHLLTAPYSPTTTGKVERFHQHASGGVPKGERLPLRHDRRSPGGTGRMGGSVQHDPPAPVDRDASADRALLPGRQTVCAADNDPEEDSPKYPPLKVPRPPGVNRWVDQRGKVRLGGFSYHVGPVFAGEPVDVVVQDGLVEILHAGVLVATHAERRKDSATSRPRRVPMTRPPRVATVGNPVSRIVDNGGSVSFAGSSYRAGRAWRRKTVEVAIVAGSVQISARRQGHQGPRHPPRPLQGARSLRSAEASPARPRCLAG